MPKPKSYHPWKTHERETAKKFGSQRSLMTGTSSPDVVTDQFIIECKYRESSFPKWIVDALEQASKYRGISKKKPIVCAKKKGLPDSLIMMWTNDFIEVLNANKFERLSD